MSYEFESRVTPFDFWRLSMSRTYRSTAGICNLVFTVSMFLLAAKFWNGAGDAAQLLLFVGCILFPVLQPVGVFVRARAQAAQVPPDMRLVFDEERLHVTIGDRHEDIRWKNLTDIVRQAHLVIVFSDTRHGYLLPDRVLGRRREEFFTFAKSKIEQEK